MHTISTQPITPARAPVWPSPESDLALAAPAGSFNWNNFTAGFRSLGELIPGRRIRVDRSLMARDGYLAGSDWLRAVHLSRLCANQRIGTVICVRGGFGSSRLLPLLAMEEIVRSRTCLVGFSDLSCLMNNLAAAGLVTMHGPVLTQLPKLDEASRLEYGLFLKGELSWPRELKGQVFVTGRAEGPLMGGNLTMLCHLAGTPFFPELSGCILALEDTNEAPYRLDRMLTQLELKGVFTKVSGVALGSFKNGGQEDPGCRAAVRRRLCNLGIPVVENLPFGHTEQNRLLPLGAMAALDGDKGLLKVGMGLD